MRQLLALVLAKLTTSTFAGEANLDDDQVVFVETPSLGQVAGTRVSTSSGSVDMFRGMRYAQPPVGSLRFEKSRPFQVQGGGVYFANRTGAWCYQANFPMKPDPSNVYSEDCLFLNVWRRSPAEESPALKQKASELLPVMFWIHGGGFTQGSGSDPLFEGRHVVLANPVVVVTINYRLGPLGFLVKDASGAGGMNGLGDAILALKWVQRNIVAFGGDPGRVTVFGESSGGEATCLLSVSPAAKGLFSRAIVESGPCVGGWGPETKAAGLRQKDALQVFHGARTLDDLRHVPAAKIHWIDPATQGYFLDDGAIMDVPPIDALNANGTHVSTLAIGGNSYDSTVELMPKPLWPTVNGTEEQYRMALAIAWPRHAQAVEKQYPMSRFNGSAGAAFTAANSDAQVFCPSLQIAAKAVRSTDVYVYRYAHLQKQCDLAYVQHDVPPGFDDWASHGSELPFVFNNTRFGDPLKVNATVDCDFSEAEKALSKSMMSLWASIAEKGVPHDRTLAAVQWPQFQPGMKETVLQLAVPSKPVDHLKQDDCNFWDSLQLAPQQQSALWI